MTIQRHVQAFHSCVAVSQTLVTYLLSHSGLAHTNTNLRVEGVTRMMAKNLAIVLVIDGRF